MYFVCTLSMEILPENWQNIPTSVTLASKISQSKMTNYSFWQCLTVCLANGSTEIE